MKVPERKPRDQTIRSASSYANVEIFTFLSGERRKSREDDDGRSAGDSGPGGRNNFKFLLRFLERIALAPMPQESALDNKRQVDNSNRSPRCSERSSRCELRSAQTPSTSQPQCAPLGNLSLQSFVITHVRFNQFLSIWGMFFWKLQLDYVVIAWAGWQLAASPNE